MGLFESSSEKMQLMDQTSTGGRQWTDQGNNTMAAHYTLTGFQVCLWVKYDLRGPIPPRPVARNFRRGVTWKTDLYISIQD